MEDVGTFNVHLVYFTSIWYILWPFGRLYGYLVHFFLVLVSCAKKNLATLFSGSRFHMEI
jgi:hypothetical protein